MIFVHLQMIFKEQNYRIVNQFEEEKFFHTDVLVKPFCISGLSYSCCLHQNCAFSTLQHVQNSDMNTLYRLNIYRLNISCPKSASVNILTNIVSDNIIIISSPWYQTDIPSSTYWYVTAYPSSRMHYSSRSPVPFFFTMAEFLLCARKWIVM